MLTARAAGTAGNAAGGSAGSSRGTAQRKRRDGIRSRQIEDCFGRDIKAIFAERFAEATLKGLAGTALENVPLFGSLSQIGGVASSADEERFYKPVMGLYMG